jgi:hypothetical protein
VDTLQACWCTFGYTEWAGILVWSDERVGFLSRIGTSWKLRPSLLWDLPCLLSMSGGCEGGGGDTSIKRPQREADNSQPSIVEINYKLHCSSLAYALFQFDTWASFSTFFLGVTSGLQGGRGGANASFYFIFFYIRIFLLGYWVEGGQIKNRNILTTSVWVVSRQKMKNVRFTGRRMDASEFWHPSWSCSSSVLAKLRLWLFVPLKLTWGAKEIRPCSGFEVSQTMKIVILFFWDVTPCT